ncbi:DUF4179 domain-containing protein [Gorillibacterium sp. sgz5001074]|uniref:DUF4179 domain-containing protein n=1 Tax=Gorillibacterium sp. sgz5001074 TaxID=3446695 RepID=UPI003F67C26A
MTERLDRLDLELEKLSASAETEALPEVPAAALDAAIAAGMAEGRRRRQTSRRRSWSLGTAAAALVLFFGLVRVSPAFATYLGGLPGMGTLVKLVAGDSGLTDAVRRDFIQPVGTEDSHDGITFTVDGIIADETRVNVFYTLRASQPFEHLLFRKLEIQDADTGKAVLASYMYSWPSETAVDREVRGRIDIGMSDGVPVPERMRITIEPNLPEAPSGASWSASFGIDKDRFRDLKEELPIHQVVTVEGQRFTVVRAVIHPTRIGLELEMDPSNTKRLFHFSELTLTDERGTVLKSQGASLTSESRQIIYFESSFFRKPKHLTLAGSRIMALDKSKLQLKLDLENKRIVDAPDSRVKLLDASPSVNGKGSIRLSVTGNPEDHYFYSLVGGPGQDADGKPLRIGDHRSSNSSGSVEYETTFEVEADGPVVNPVTFDLMNYPAWIEEPFSVKLK